MEEILSKRIMFLTNTLIVLCGIGFLTLIHRLDAGYKAKEYIALNKLLNCVKELPANAGDPDVMALAAKGWLRKAQPNFFADYSRFAGELADALAQTRYKEDVRSIKGASDRQEDFMLLTVRVNDSAACCEHGLGNLSGTHKLNHFIEQYRHIRKPVNVTIATGMPPGTLQSALENNSELKRIREMSAPKAPPAPGSIPEETPEDHYPRHDDRGTSAISARVESVRLEGDSIVMAFQLLSSMLQTDPFGPNVKVAVQTSPVPATTLLDIYGIDADFNALQESVELEKLQKHYGELPLDQVLALVGADYMKANESIDVLGFSFSTTSMPLALLCFLLFVSAGIYIMVREGVKRGLKVFSFENEDMTGYFLRRRWIRLVLWIVLPVLALAATFPSVEVEDLKLYILTTGAALLLAINTMSLLEARKL